MDNRWTPKDFVIVGLLLVVILVVLLAMVQFDRQYQVVQQLERNSSQQLTALVDISRKLDRGIAMVPTNGVAPATQSATGLPGPFDEINRLKAAGKYAQGDWLVENLQETVAKLTPLLSTDVYAAYVQARVIESLVYRDANTLQYVPQLAEGWEPTVDNRKAWQAYIDQRKPIPLTEDEIIKEDDCPPPAKAGDRKAYIDKRLKEGRRPEDIESEPACPPAISITFTIRKGVTFSDGTPFGADDVIFSFDWIMNPKINAPRERSAYQKIKAVRKSGDDKVTFDFNEPYFSAFDLAGGLGVMSKAFYSHYTPEDFNASVGLLIGTGPYRLASPTDWKPNAAGTIELIRNERYWGETSSFNKLVYYQVPSDQSDVTMFINGQTDTFGATPEQYGQLLKNQDVLSRSQHFEYQSPTSGYSFIAWNQKRPIFADKRVRQALTQLVDRKSICSTIMLGYAQPAAGPFNPLSQQNDPALADWQYDPTAAKQLLKDAGYEIRDSSGVLKKADGTPLAFKLTYGSKNETVERIMLLVKDNLVRAGVAATADPVDWPIMEKMLDSRDFDAISLGWSAGLEDDIFQMFDSSQMADGADNFMSYANPELDHVIEAARTELDESKRMPLWRKAQDILHDDQPYTFLLIRKSLAFMDQRIQNIHASKMGLNFDRLSSAPIEWSVPVELQKYKN